ncbi:MAG: LytTR family DNA-binding domain-containing protein [Rhodobacteraceae bacterium]|nr:LytTR family DNA-binding domain-containing protein [Paracoccaceae bacterium]
MLADVEKIAGCELRLKFANGSFLPFDLHELVATIRHPKIMTLTCVFAVLLALPGGAAFSAEIPLWARICLNLISVYLFAILFPALLREAHLWATRRALRIVLEPAITISAAVIVTLAVESIVVLIVGHADKSRWDLVVKLLIGACFWQLHVTLMLLFLGPAIRAKEAARKAQLGTAPSPQVARVQIGNMQFAPEKILRIETDGHFLIVHSAEGTSRVLASMTGVQDGLESLGLQVHRCHWVAYGELGEVRRNGRSYVMVTRSGAEIAVARDRRKSVAKAVQEMAAS